MVEVTVFTEATVVKTTEAGASVASNVATALCACVPQLCEELINTMLCPPFLRKFVCQLLCSVPLQIQTF